MCGIAGWVDFGQDLTSQRPVIQAMTDAIASRGIDDNGIWTAPHALLGHTRTAIIDPAGGIQPMVADDSAAILVYSGEVYNFRQLRTELEGLGHKFRTRSDTEVVLHSYMQWGADCGNHFDGIFAFAAWDPMKEELLLVRDRLGVKPLFYHRTANGVVFGSEPKALLRHPDVRPRVDMDGLRFMLSTAKTPGQAVFQDMKEVLPGHTLTVTAGGVVDRTYWKLEARPHTEDLPSTVSTVRTMLSDIVLQELVADVPLCVGLSGGLDSSSIAALAAHWLWKLEGERVRTITTSFENLVEQFRVDDQRETPDAPFAHQLARHINADHTDLVLSASDLVDPEVRLACLLAQDQPSTLADMDASQFLMLKAIRERNSVVLTGEISDEVFGGFKWMFQPAYVNAETFAWEASFSDQAAGRNTNQGLGLFSAGELLNKMDMPAYNAANYHQTLAETPHQDNESPIEHRMRAITYAHLARFMPMLLQRGDRLAMAHGLEVRVPFGNYRLVEYLYNTPWAYKTFDGREKSLLRAAMRDLLPESVLNRQKAPYPVTQDPHYTKLLHERLSDVLADPSSPVLPLIDVPKAKKLAADAVSDRANTWHSHGHVETVLQFNSWMEQYSIDLAI